MRGWGMRGQGMRGWGMSEGAGYEGVGYEGVGHEGVGLSSLSTYPPACVLVSLPICLLFVCLSVCSPQGQVSHRS